MKIEQTTRPISEEDIRRSAAYQTMKIKATQAFSQLNQRLEGLEGTLNQRLSALERQNQERMRLVEGSHSALQQSLDLLKTWRGQFNARLGELEKVVSTLAKTRPEPSDPGTTGAAKVVGRQSTRRKTAPVFSTVMAALAGILVVETALFGYSYMQGRRSNTLLPTAVIPTVTPELSPSPAQVAASIPVPEPRLSPVVSPAVTSVQPAVTQRPRRWRSSPRRPVPSYVASWAPHQVQKGETWYSLARRHGLTAQQLMRLNSIMYPRSLRSGEVIRVPGTIPNLPTNPQNLTMMTAPAGEAMIKNRVQPDHPGHRIIGVLKKRIEPLVQPTPQANAVVNRPPTLY